MRRRKIIVDFGDMPAYTRPEAFRGRQTARERWNPRNKRSLDPNDDWEHDEMEVWSYLFDDVGDK